MAANAPVRLSPRALPQPGKVFDQTFPVIVMADTEGIAIMVNLLASDDQSVRNRLLSQRELWLAHRILRDDPCLAADLIEKALYHLEQEHKEQQKRGALHDALLNLHHRIAEHWRAANQRLEALWLALKGGGE
jgi:hypothetical protein